jgi:hypothetical protein
MKILIINLIIKKIKNDTGGTVGTERNIELLRMCFGVNNIVRYDVPYYSSKLKAFFYSLSGYCGGLTPKIQNDLLYIIKNTIFDCIFFNNSQFGKLIKYINKNIKTITFFHNVEYVFLNLFLRKVSLLLKFVYYPRKRLVFISERNIALFCNKIIVLSKRDSNELKKIYHREADLILPLSFSDKYSSIDAVKYDKLQEGNILLFVGSNFFGNIEGIFWFIEECLDKINAKLLVVGSGMEIHTGKYINKRVEFLGYVQDIAKYYYQSDIVVLPILSGSGMKTKTCEALMFGKTIFGTSEAFIGYEALDLNKNDWLCNTADEFVEKINYYLKNKTSKINEYSRMIFLQNYSSSILKDVLYQFLIK